MQRITVCEGSHNHAEQRYFALLRRVVEGLPEKWQGPPGQLLYYCLNLFNQKTFIINHWHSNIIYFFDEEEYWLISKRFNRISNLKSTKAVRQVLFGYFYFVLKLVKKEGCSFANNWQLFLEQFHPMNRAIFINSLLQNMVE